MPARVSARVVAVTGLALAAAGYAVAAGWPQPAQMVTGLSIAALGIGATFVTAFTTSLADAGPAEGGLRSAVVNTFHELGGAAGVAVLSSAAGAGLVTAHPGSHDFARAFTAGAACAAASTAIAVALVRPSARTRRVGRPPRPPPPVTTRGPRHRGRGAFTHPYAEAPLPSAGAASVVGIGEGGLAVFVERADAFGAIGMDGGAPVCLHHDRDGLLDRLALAHPDRLLDGLYRGG